MLKVVLGSALLAVFAMASESGSGAEFERPPSFSAQNVLGAAVRGANYSVARTVPSDGFLRSYTFQTSFGAFSANGDEMALMRIRELNALDALDKTTRSQKFTDAVAKAGLAPFDLAGKLATNPVDAVSDTFSGVGQLLGGVASGVKHIGRSKDSTLASVTGASKQKRLIAVQLGVDPYTDFRPLAEKLDALSGYAAAGGILVTAAFAVIPGAAGAVISNVSTADTLNSMARDYSPDQLTDISREKLAKLGITGVIADGLLSNSFYTPVDVAAIVDALGRMGNMRGFDVAVAHAASAQSRDAAYLVRRRVELTAAYQERTRQLTGFVQPRSLAFPMSTTADGGIVGVFPFDCLAWTKDAARSFTIVSEESKGGAKVIEITGTATALARMRLRALGWIVRERSPR